MVVDGLNDVAQKKKGDHPRWADDLDCDPRKNEERKEKTARALLVSFPRAAFWGRSWPIHWSLANSLHQVQKLANSLDLQESPDRQKLTNNSSVANSLGHQQDHDLMANLVRHEIEGAVAQLVVVNDLDCLDHLGDLNHFCDLCLGDLLGDLDRFCDLCLGDQDRLGDLDFPRLGEPNCGDCDGACRHIWYQQYMYLWLLAVAQYQQYMYLWLLVVAQYMYLWLLVVAQYQQYMYLWLLAVAQYQQYMYLWLLVVAQYMYLWLLVVAQYQQYMYLWLLAMAHGRWLVVVAQ
eukprot:Em0001g3600a